MGTSASKALQDYIFTSKYARFIKDKHRRETYGEAVDRVRDMMLTKYHDKDVKNEINWAYDLMRKQRVLGSQRALQFGGDPIFKKNARMFNCVSSYADRPKFFQEYFWLLLCGCGAGFSVQKHHVNKLPPISNLRVRFGNYKRDIITHTIPDTIEGWSDAIGILLTTYFDVAIKPEWDIYVGSDVEFDYSAIRPEGADLSSGVGKAPGPDGLRFALDKIRELLDRFVSESHIKAFTLVDSYIPVKLRPIHVYDICMHISDAVLSGGVRRSSTIALFSPDDEEMAKAKTGNWLSENPQRARSNNSALLVRNKTTREQFNELMNLVRSWGEPGFVWADSTEFLVNPCVEIGFFAYDIIDNDKFQAWKKDHTYDPIECDPAEIGLESGWQGCNLSTTNCSRLIGATIAEKTAYYLDNVKAAAIIGTLQAGFTDFDYLTPASSNIFKREALIGVSMTGMMDNYDIVLDPTVQEAAAKIVLEANEIIAKKIGINLAARTTCLKPEGSGTLILMVSAHGCHPHHYVRYLRAVQANRNEAPFQFFKKVNPQACEKSLWSANDTDEIIYFPIEVPDGAKIKNQIPALELLKIVKSTQKHWVLAGRRLDLCTMPWLTHNVSNTVTINPEEWDDVEKFVYDNNQYFAGISFVPDSADKDYPQAPNCAVYTAKQIVQEYGDAALWTSGLIDMALQTFNNNLWTACSFLLDSTYDKENPTDSELMDILDDDKTVFYFRCKKFAARYFNNDMRILTYCMKDVFNWKRWKDLNESLIAVDYTELIEEEDNTKLEQTVACAGGVCLL